MADETMKFKFSASKDRQNKAMLANVYEALKEKGYDPVNQIVGYLVTEDPVYITTNRNARNLIIKTDRFELLRSLVRNYLEIDE